MISIRRIFPDTDRGLYVDAYLWEQDYPRWFREMMPPLTLKKMLELAHGEDQCDVGIFNGSLFALATMSLRAKGTYEIHLTVKRGTDAELLQEGLAGLKGCINRDLHPVELYSWIAKRNIPTRKLCVSMGLREQGLTRTHGSYHGKPIEWVLYSEKNRTS